MSIYRATQVWHAGRIPNFASVVFACMTPSTVLGPIPSELRGLSALEELLLQHNQLIGEA